MRSISVLMSVYEKDTPEQLDECLASLAAQTVKPMEVVLVVDGPISANLHAVVRNWMNGDLTLRVLYLGANRGLARALNAGLKLCRGELVARMDADDVCVPNRLELQEELMRKRPDVGVVGGMIDEYDDPMRSLLGRKLVPESHEDISRYMDFRNPMNHMSVMFRKRIVDEHGSYPVKYRLFQDYAMWFKLRAKGVVFHNLPTTLVKARAGSKMLTRRRGLQYLLWELEFFLDRLREGDVGPLGFLAAFSSRLSMRLMPVGVMKFIYGALRGRHVSRS